jgi:hypothetical protein
MALRFFHNHIGFDVERPKHVLVDVSERAGEELGFKLQSVTGVTALEGTLGGAQGAWRGQTLRSADISAAPAGRYWLEVDGQRSAPFWVGPRLLLERTLDTVLAYYAQQRCAEPWDSTDRSAPFVGERTERVDVSGGWYDASGDVSKYLSHLSYANFFNPQQTPIVVWALLEHLERRSSHAVGVRERLLDEALHGADFLCRMQDPAGYFYMTLFDKWSKKLEERQICAYKTQQGIRLEGYQSGYRQGGGATIAALARAARVLETTVKDATRAERYRAAAERGFSHLEEHNVEYLDDGRENIIDDYCALLAATELYALTKSEAHLAAARKRSASLEARVMRSGPLKGWLRADDGERPFFHAAEAGLPVVALLRFSEIEPDKAHAERLRSRAAECLAFELAITSEVDNPYGYARQFTQSASGVKKTAFFIPHDNETGYWWQGENARLGSLAGAAGLFCRLDQSAEHAALREQLRAFAFDQLDWILGKNPFDSCMLHGFGRNNVDYMLQWPNCAGGILNGITSGYTDEDDIDFARTEGVVGDHSWRWQEQWIPHAAWYLVALAELTV